MLLVVFIKSSFHLINVQVSVLALILETSEVNSVSVLSGFYLG